jgi:hypothetical protein
MCFSIMPITGKEICILMDGLFDISHSDHDKIFDKNKRRFQLIHLFRLLITNSFFTDDTPRNWSYLKFKLK